jgi:hypothetical protein
MEIAAYNNHHEGSFFPASRSNNSRLPGRSSLRPYPIRISRTIAGAAGAQRDLVEALALAHDIGHPPFGHSRRKGARPACMRRYGELRFDHNLHALRIVEVSRSATPRFAG